MFTWIVAYVKYAYMREYKVAYVHVSLGVRCLHFNHERAVMDQIHPRPGVWGVIRASDPDSWGGGGGAADRKMGSTEGRWRGGRTTLRNGL